MLTFRASSMGGCPRALYFQALGLEGEPRDLESRLTLRLGTVMEPVILEELGYQVEDSQKEVVLPVGRGVQIVGHPDGRVGDLLLEVKTMNDFAWQQAKKQGIKAYYPFYVMQGGLYLRALDCRALRFVCYNKNTSAHFEQDYEAVEVYPFVLRALNKARRLARQVELGTPPERPHNLPAWRCKKKYCEYWHCHLNDGHKAYLERRAA